MTQYKPTKHKLRLVMQAPYAASVRNASGIEIPSRSLWVLVREREEGEDGERE